MTDYNFSLTKDIAEIRRVVLTKENIPFQFDDTWVDPMTWMPNVDGQIANIEVRAPGGEIMGYFFLVKMEPVTVEAHMTFLPSAYGSVAEMGRQCLDWVWKYMNIATIIAPVLKTNALAIKCVKDMGFQEYGIDKSRVLKDGIWEDYLLLRIERKS